MAENIYLLLQQACEKYSEKIFIVYENQQFSFHEVIKNVDCFASYFDARRINYGDRILIQLPNIPEFIYSVFAAYKIGAIPVLVNPMARRFELEHYVQITKPSLIITQRDNYAHFEKFYNAHHAIPFALMDAKDTLTEIYANLNSNRSAFLKDSVTIGEDHPAAIIFTSAEDGTPGGAMITHRGIIGTARASNEFAVRDDDVFLAVLPLFHAFGLTTSLFLPLYNCCQVVLVNKFSVKKTALAITKGEVTIFCGVPIMFELIAKILPKGHAFGRLRACVSGGEAIPVSLQKQYVENFGIEIRQGYGLTEASPIVTWNVGSLKNRHGSIGVPLSYNEVKMIKDGKENPKEGELYVRGINVVPGYYNNPEKTKEKIQHGWLKTGDIVEKDSDGYFFIRGRSKNMILRNGLNVYPEEVKKIFLLHPDVEHVEVEGYVNINEDYSGKDRLTVKIWTKSGSPLTENSFKEWCLEHISAYKIPDAIEVVK
ncbi:MAG: AMP-binding protein [Spirochaetes bacterium]|nr:AMP-binding protein [Spirochaetota bacterium]